MAEITLSGNTTVAAAVDRANGDTNIAAILLERGRVYQEHLPKLTRPGLTFGAHGSGRRPIVDGGGSGDIYRAVYKDSDALPHDTLFSDIEFRNATRAFSIECVGPVRDETVPKLRGWMWQNCVFHDIGGKEPSGGSNDDDGALFWFGLVSPLVNRCLFVRASGLHFRDHPIYSTGFTDNPRVWNSVFFGGQDGGQLRGVAAEYLNNVVIGARIGADFDGLTHLERPLSLGGRHPTVTDNIFVDVERFGIITNRNKGGLIKNNHVAYALAAQSRVIDTNGKELGNVTVRDNHYTGVANGYGGWVNDSPVPHVTVGNYDLETWIEQWGTTHYNAVGLCAVLLDNAGEQPTPPVPVPPSEPTPTPDYVTRKEYEEAMNALGLRVEKDYKLTNERLGAFASELEAHNKRLASLEALRAKIAAAAIGGV